jgi:uncharacterized protein
MATWRPSPDDIARVLAEQNPWHADNEVPTALAPPVERSLVAPLHQRLLGARPHRFHVILGHRRVGKTTAMYQVVRRLLDGGTPARRLWWHRLDHPLLMEVPLDTLVGVTLRLAGASSERPAAILLDEVVYARDWDLWLKTFYDERWPVRLIATSSATAALRDRRTESGVGRWEEHLLPPFLLSEYLRLRGHEVDIHIEGHLGATIEGALAAPPALEPLRRAARRLMLVGGFPELLDELGDDLDEASAALESQRTLRSDAVERAIYKDIPQSFGIESPLMLERVLYVLAAQMAGLLSPTGIARDLGMSQPTVDRYLSYLAQAFLVFTLPNYSGRETTVQRRGRKLYFVDGAVRNAALQRGAALLGDDTELGALRENMAAAHLHALGSLTQTRLFHWRSGNDEVDLIFDHAERPLAFEVASSPNHSRRGLHRFLTQHPRFHGGAYLVAPGAPTMSPATGEGVGTLPLELFLAVVSAQCDAAVVATLGGGVGAQQDTLFG